MQIFLVVTICFNSFLCRLELSLSRTFPKATNDIPTLHSICKYTIPLLNTFIKESVRSCGHYWLTDSHMNTYV